MKFIELVELYEKLEATTKRLEKTFFISEFLKKVPEEDLPEIALLLQGKLFPAWDERKIGVASRLVLKAISAAAGIDAAKIEHEWKKKGDLGEVAAELVKHKKQTTLMSASLTVKKVFESLRKLPGLEGEGAVDRKVGVISELLSSAKPKEAKYIIRTVLEDLRVGVGDGSLRDAIVWAFFGKEIKINYDEKEKEIAPEDREKYNHYVESVQHAYNLCNDFSKVILNAKHNKLAGLKDVELSIGKPIKVMLYQKADDIEEAFERVGKPAVLDFKYDGFRIQIHRHGDIIKLYTRRLEEVTKQFPEVVKYVKEFVKGKDFILDSEAVGYDPGTKKYLPFQAISQRIKRKYDIDEMAGKYPVEVNIFDIIAHEGKNVMSEPYKKRRELIHSMVKTAQYKIRCAKSIITGNIKEADKFYHESLKSGEEGIMVKNLEGVYKPGSRVGYGVKVKPVMETLDLVIIGAQWGEGKRGGWLSSFDIACLNKDKKEYLEIGKVGTGIKELEGEGGEEGGEGGSREVTFTNLTKMLKPLIIGESGRNVKVKPKIIIEVNYEEIQKSPTYSSGFALRFPRVKMIRHDKPLSEISDIDYIEKLYGGQRGRHGKGKRK